MVLATPHETRWRSNSDVAAALGLLDDLAARRTLCPADWYEPHHTVLRSPSDPKDAPFDRKGLSSGQLQFHQSIHPVRIMAPGNGWGGSAAMACEVDAWCRHTNRWQQTPSHPIKALWFCPKYDQFDALLVDLREIAFGDMPRLYGGGLGGVRLVWPNGSKLVIGSYDSAWTKYQGAPWDLVAFDEQPPADLWREMQQRRRGKRKTRFICKATQTEGLSWMSELYFLWKQFHADQGLDEEQAMLKQLHDYYWIWAKGGIHDNAAMDDQDVREYEQRVWPTAKTRKVRLFGGFERWNNYGVFDSDALDWQRLRAAQLEAQHPARHGSFVLTERKEAA